MKEKKMKIAVAGTGYVGLSLAVLLSQHNEVHALDIVPEKVEKLQRYETPIQDDEIERFMGEAKAGERVLDLHVTLDVTEAYMGADYVVVATPTNYDSDRNFFDTSSVEAAIGAIRSVSPTAWIVIKSTIPVGYTASLYPLWTGLATPEQALSTLRNAERLLECRHGIACCEKYDSGHNYQWDYPNGWAPLQLIAIESFDRYGFRDAALRLAEKYVDLVSANFHRTGDLWEKYNVVDGSIEAKSEYGTPRMMGWTAGVFVYAADYLEKNRRQRENSAGEVERKPNP